MSASPSATTVLPAPALSQRLGPYVFLAVVVCAVYATAFTNQFVFDDDLLIRMNEYLVSWKTFGHLFTASTTDGAHIAGGFYRPVQNILYFFVFQIFGLRPFGFHLLNLMVHAANACLGYRLALRLNFDARAALLGALLWAVHPLHTEAVTYMSGTADPLYLMFGLLGLNGLIPTFSPRRVVATLPLFVLALLSKETAVIFPPLAVLCLWHLHPERTKLKTYLPLWPLWTVALAFLGWRVTNNSFDGPARYIELMKLPAYSTMRIYVDSHWVRLLTFCAELPNYAALIFWPSDLYMERSFPLHTGLDDIQVLGGIAMIGAALATIVLARKPALQPLRWGLLWFGIALAPDSGLAFPMNALFLEHWMYVPTLGLFMGTAAALAPLMGRLKQPALQAMVVFGCMGLLAVLSSRTVAQNQIWSTPVSFYRNIFAHGVLSPRAHNNLAIAYMEMGDFPDAIKEYQQAIAEADTYAETHYNLAIALSRLPNAHDNIPLMIEHLQRAIEIEPGFYRAYNSLGDLYAIKGDAAQAEAYHRKGKELLGN